MRTRELISLVLVALSVASCSSGAAPGTQSVLDQADKATKAQVDVALQDLSRAETSHQASTGAFTANLQELGINPPAAVTLSIVNANESAFCAEATHGDLEGTWHISNTAPVVAEGPC